MDAGNVSTPKSTERARPEQQEGERSGAIPTTTVPNVSESSRPSTVTFTREELERMIRFLKPDADPTLVLPQIETDPAPLPTGDGEVPEPHSGDTMDAEEFKRMEEGEEVEQQLQAAGEVEENLVEDIVEAIVNPGEKEAEKADVSPAKHGVKGASAMEEEQPLPTAEEVVENLAKNVSEVDKMVMDHYTQEVGKSDAMEVEENQDFEVNPTARVETDPVEDVETNTNVPENEEIVILTDGEEEAEKVPPSVDAVKPEVAAVRTYQRPPAREETSEKRPGEERPRETTGQ